MYLIYHLWGRKIVTSAIETKPVLGEIGTRRPDDNIRQIFIAEADEKWCGLYKKNLGKIVGESNLIIVTNYCEGCITLNKKYPNADFVAYIIEPELYVAEDEKKERYGNKWGLDLAYNVKEQLGDYNLVWLVSSNHDLLEKGKEGGINHIYTKRENQEREQYKRIDDFFADIKRALI